MLLESDSRWYFVYECEAGVFKIPTRASSFFGVQIVSLLSTEAFSAQRDELKNFWNFGIGRSILFGIVIIIIAITIIGFVATGNLTSNTVTPPTTTVNPSNLSTSSNSLTTSLSTSLTLQSESSLESGTAHCASIGGLPDRTCTPGATDPAVNQSDIQSTICVSGWTETIRPNETYTENLKYYSIKDYGYNDTYLSDYEEDHLIPLELGGSPTSVYNLWAQPHYGTWNSFVKDDLEDYLNAQVCDGKMSLVQAQQDIASNWVYYYQQFISANPTITTENGYGD